jgi:hypothetical protein
LSISSSRTLYPALTREAIDPVLPLPLSPIRRSLITGLAVSLSKVGKVKPPNEFFEKKKIAVLEPDRSGVS